MHNAVAIPVSGVLVKAAYTLPVFTGRVHIFLLFIDLFSHMAMHLSKITKRQ